MSTSKEFLISVKQGKVTLSSIVEGTSLPEAIRQVLDKYHIPEEVLTQITIRQVVRSAGYKERRYDSKQQTDAACSNRVV